MDPFLRACEATGPLQLDVEGPDARRVWRQVLEQPFALIGRDPRSDLTLVDGRISHRHAYIQMIGGRVFCVDLGSRTGIGFRDGHRRYGWLERDQEIGIGPYTIRLRGGDRDREDDRSELVNHTNILGLEVSDAAPLPGLSLSLRDQGNRLSWKMKRVLVLVGTKSECKLRLVDPSISSIHCALVRTAVGPWVVDLLGRGGITVNGSAVRSARLREGDELQIGRFTIRVHSGTADPEALRAIGYSPGHALALRSRTAELPASSASETAPPELLPACLPSFELRPLAGAPAAASELAGSVLTPLLDQFGLMQQQMLDQFQQTMMMVVQMFGTMHRDQAELIRSEFERLNELTQEIQAIKTELTSRPEASRGTAPTGVPASESPGPESAKEARSERARTATPPSADQEEFLLRLHQRLSAIQEERQSRWQKLLTLLPGAVRGEAAP